jgi:hypothetical protein
MSASHRPLTAFVGAGAHPRSAAAVYLPERGYCSPGDRSHGDAAGPVYEFNSLGFRSAEYDPDAALRIFVCGCSYTIGMGVDRDRAWPVVFTRLAAAALGTPVEHSHLQNFSQIGASNNYVARTLLTQCDRHAPTLAIAAFTHTSRTEYLDGPVIRNLGHWDIHPDNEAREADSPGRRFFRQHSGRAGLRNLLANMVLFQSAMERRGVPYIIAWVDAGAMQTRVLAGPGLHDYAAVLNRSRISRLSIRQHGIFVDTAAGAAAQGHPGPQSHERFAAALAQEFTGRLLARRSISHVRQRPEAIDLDDRTGRASSDRLARRAVRAARRRPRAIRLSLGDNLSAELFAGGRAVEIDLERRAWTLNAARLRAAHADYVTADVLRFNMWLNLLTIQEFLLARGVRPQLAVARCWSLQAAANPVLEQLAALVDGDAISIIENGAQSGIIDLAARLDAAKRRIRHSRIDAWLGRFGQARPHLADDPNTYPLW